MNTRWRTVVQLMLLVAAVGAANRLWVQSVQQTQGQRVAALARVGDIEMLSSDTCGVCLLARRWFTQHGVAFRECSIERDPACRARFNATLAPGTPVLLVRGRVLVGFDAQRLLQALGGQPGD